VTSYWEACDDFILNVIIPAITQVIDLKPTPFDSEGLN
jgi:hypothetical protein